MIFLQDNDLLKRVKKLEINIQNLERLISYIEYAEKGCHPNTPMAIKRELSADAVLCRFDELYAHLNIERTIVPAIPPTTMFTKIKI